MGTPTNLENEPVCPPCDGQCPCDKWWSAGRNSDCVTMLREWQSRQAKHAEMRP